MTFPADITALEIPQLVALLQIGADELRDLTAKSQSLYSRYPQPKKSGGVRIIEAPAPALKRVQKNLLTSLLVGFPCHQYMFGGPGTSIKEAVRDHVQKPVVITMDLSNFFPSVKTHMVKTVLDNVGFSPQVAKIIQRLVTFRGHLPQGAPTSPCLARLILSPAAMELEDLLERTHPGCRCSIYVDDITLSGPTGLARLCRVVERIFRRHGFRLKTAPPPQVMFNNTHDQVSLNIKLNRRIEATSKYLREVEELAAKVPADDPSLKGKRAFIKYLRS